MTLCQLTDKSADIKSHFLILLTVKTEKGIAHLAIKVDLKTMLDFVGTEKITETHISCK